MNAQQYLEMCEQMGWEAKEEEMPINPATLPLESQQALIILKSLPDLWDGMSGSWLGKDYSGLVAIMDIYDIDNRKIVFELYKEAEKELGDYYAQKQKEAAAQSKRAR
ncbi:hypothetical protein KAU11_12050 [Candidatus Babeliales bacterium]|nr:hypothetical protein [Candidatus Babeliales bacterium]